MSDVPALGELARLATEAMEAAESEHDWFPADSLSARTFGFGKPFAAFIAACSPAVILQLVALATGGATAMDGLAKSRDELLSLITVPPPPRRSPNVQGFHSVAVIERAIAAIDDARSLTPERPADAALRARAGIATRCGADAPTRRVRLRTALSRARQPGAPARPHRDRPMSDARAGSTSVGRDHEVGFA